MNSIMRISKLSNICSLQREKAIEAIQGTKTVMYKHGVWNEYYERKTEDVIESIKKSGYGADVRRDDTTGQFYVSVPADCDMW